MAGRVNGFLVSCILSVLDDDVTRSRKEPAIAAVPSGHNTVEHVHAKRNALNEVHRGANSHQISWLSHRQELAALLHHFIHDSLGFSHRQPANGIPGEFHIKKSVYAFMPEFRMDSALSYPKQPLSVGPALSLISGKQISRPACPT